MGVAIKELTHPYSHTCKDCQKKKKKDEAFCVGFPRERERKEREFLFEFSKAIFPKFPYFF